MNQEHRINILAVIGAVFLFILFFNQDFIKNKFRNLEKINANQKASSTPVTFEEISHGDISKRQVVFTFDGGSGAESGDLILNVLMKHSIKGTFFLTGKFIENNPALVTRMSKEGHEIYNHTYNHPHLSTLIDSDIISEFEKMNNLLLKLTGHSSKPYFRAPYGDRDDHVLNAAQQAGYQSVYWSVDALDWQESTGMTETKVENKIMSTLKPGNIYLMHVGDNITGSILDSVFTNIEARGYNIVSLTQGL